jgi:protein TonB
MRRHDAVQEKDTPMYADRYGQQDGLKPGSVMLALGMTALPIVGLVLSLEVRQILDPVTHLTAVPIAAPKPPPPPDPQPKPPREAKAAPDEKVFVPPLPQIPITPIDPVQTTEKLTPPQPPMPPGTGDIGTVVKPQPPSVFTDAGIDSRYANAFQPPYPASEIRAGNEGRVVVRVLIGTDGRVKQVERVSATNDAFFAAAERQALTKWRFRPATKDGVPIEQWKQMSLRFQLNGQDQ